MYRSQLFVNREEAIKCGDKTRLSKNKLTIAKVLNNLINIVNHKLSDIQYNVALYESFLEASNKKDKQK